jgi:hypothetical protein
MNAIIRAALSALRLGSTVATLAQGLPPGFVQQIYGLGW